ncbi:MAG: hypothetical protein Q7K26_01555 [bacterium]|nr:hypothetical protein [bacterium]
MALSQFLSNWDETRQDEVIDAMYSDDEELIEELKITVWDPISDHPLKNVAGFIMDAEHTLEFQLAHVINSVTDPMTEFTDNVRKLVVSIERNYPDDIAKQSAIVKAMLPAEDDDHRVPGIAP